MVGYDRGSRGNQFQPSPAAIFGDDDMNRTRKPD